MKNISFTSMTLMLAMACGDDNKEATQTPFPGTTATAADQSDSTGESHAFAGFVANAFEVTVDGVNYRDLEDFYTKEMDRLPQKVQAAGYDSSYNIEFDAEIGFSDLWHGMDVYILSTGPQGYQGQATVGSHGAFSMELPDAALNETFKVRANKRIRVIISNSQDQKTLCYNFSAREQSVPFEETSKPIILDNFETSLTKYDCPSATQNNGLALPAQTNTRLRPGMSKSQVLGVLGSVGLTIQDSQTWCWDAAQTLEQSICSVDSGLNCTCSALFDSNGRLEAIDNIRSQWLDILAW